MSAMLRWVLALLTLSLVLGSGNLHAAGSSESTLGRGHLWLEFGRLDLAGEGGGFWGLDREAFLSLEGYARTSHGWYLGGEIGRAGFGSGANGHGDELRDVRLLWLEMNGKDALDLGHGWCFEAGLGWALLWVDGDEVSGVGRGRTTDPLADLGLGAQVFAGVDWKARRFLAGLSLKYQWANDLIDIDYSNFRFAGHAGIAF